METFIPTSERYGRDIPQFLRWLGCFRMLSDSWGFIWGEIGFRRLGFALEYSVYHDEAHIRICIGWPAFYFKVPMIITQRPGTEDWNATYGFATFEGAIHFNWRLKCKIIHMPWTWGSAVRWSVFDAIGRKIPKIHEYGKDKGPYEDGRHVETHPFVYVLRSGEIQKRTATIWGEEMEWRLRYFPWLPWPRLIKRSIAITFSDEVGERSGSWKGGTIGCSFDWRNGESMRSCLQRMQHEREFK